MQYLPRETEGPAQQEDKIQSAKPPNSPDQDIPVLGLSEQVEQANKGREEEPIQHKNQQDDQGDQDEPDQVQSAGHVESENQIQQKLGAVQRQENTEEQLDDIQPEEVEKKEDGPPTCLTQDCPVDREEDESQGDDSQTENEDVGRAEERGPDQAQPEVAVESQDDGILAEHRERAENLTQPEDLTNSQHQSESTMAESCILPEEGTTTTENSEICISAERDREAEKKAEPETQADQNHSQSTEQSNAANTVKQSDEVTDPASARPQGEADKETPMKSPETPAKDVSDTEHQYHHMFPMRRARFLEESPLLMTQTTQLPIGHRRPSNSQSPSSTVVQSPPLTYPCGGRGNQVMLVAPATPSYPSPPGDYMMSGLSFAGTPSPPPPHHQQQQQQQGQANQGQSQSEMSSPPQQSYYTLFVPTPYYAYTVYKPN